MLIAGSWQMRHDGTTRPIVHGGVAHRDGSLVAEDFLIDSGADVNANGVVAYSPGLPSSATLGSQWIVNLNAESVPSKAPP